MCHTQHITNQVINFIFLGKNRDDFCLKILASRGVNMLKGHIGKGTS